jgi:hypothetical protein
MSAFCKREQLVIYGNRRTSIYLSAVLLCIGATPAVAQVGRPKAPVLCIDGASCVADQPPAPAGSADQPPVLPAKRGTGVKWHPGHYVALRGDYFAHGPSAQSHRFTFYNTITNNTSLEGVVIGLRWSSMEGAQGNYSAGFAEIHSEIAYLQSLNVPKRLILRVEDQGNPSEVFPSYILNGQCNANDGQKGNWEYWTPSCVDAFVAMLTAWGNEFDDNPYLEGLHIMEEVAVSSLGEGYSIAGLDAGLRRIVAEVKPAWPHTNLALPLNWHATQAYNKALVEYLPGQQVGWGAPDTCPTCVNWGERVVRGEGGTHGTHDYRGEIPIISAIESSEMGDDSVGRAGGHTPAQIFDWAMNMVGSNYLLWDYQDYAESPIPPCDSSGACKWTTGILPFIDKHPTVAHTACPAVYESCDTD